MKKILLSLVTHSAYVDVCYDFLQLLRKNWDDCKYDIVISVIGDEVNFCGYKTINYGKNVMLADALYRTVSNMNYDYCISFLGDAFIYKTVNSKIIDRIISIIIKNKINYCCLIPHRRFSFKNNDLNSGMRYIQSDDSYNMSFVAFIASKEFIEEEFKNKSDMEFELKYLIGASNKPIHVYKDRLILKKNYFNIVPGIEAGKWNRFAYKKIKRSNHIEMLCQREKVPFGTTIKNETIHYCQMVIKRKHIIKIKKMLSRFGMEFVSNH